MSSIYSCPQNCSTEQSRLFNFKDLLIKLRRKLKFGKLKNSRTSVQTNNWFEFHDEISIPDDKILNYDNFSTEDALPNVAGYLVKNVKGPGNDCPNCQ